MSSLTIMLVRIVFFLLFALGFGSFALILGEHRGLVEIEHSSYLNLWDFVLITLFILSVDPVVDLGLLLVVENDECIIPL